MFRRNNSHNNILGLVLIIFGSFIVFIAMGGFLFRALVAFFGLYLIYHGLQMRNQYNKIVFFFHQVGDRFNRFSDRF